MKTLNTNQLQKIGRPWTEPTYFVHIYLTGETLYLSNKNFLYNGHDYEAYLGNLPALAQSIEQLGGYLNVNAQLEIWNKKFRDHETILEWLDDFPITRKEMDLFVLYKDPGELFSSDVSTKLARLAIGELKNITRQTFLADLSSILHYLDNKNPFVQINTTNWPNAAPDAIGKHENIWYGPLRDVPCHCVQTYAVSTLFVDMAASGETYIKLSDADYPISFPTSGCVQIGSEQIDYDGKNSDTERLTVQTRGVNGTTAAIHKRGTPVWLVETPIGTALSFKYLAAGHVMKSISTVYAGQDRVRIPGADYTADLDDAGKATITFTKRQMEKVLEILAASSTVMNEGSHTHPMPGQQNVYGSSAGYAESGLGWSNGGVADDMRDQSDLTVKWASNSGESSAEASFVVNFTNPGGTPSKIYACIMHMTAFNTGDGAYIKLYKTVGGAVLVANLSSTSKTTQKFDIGATFPSQLYVQVYTGSPTGHIEQHYNYEMWLEVVFSDTGAHAATGVDAAVTVTVAGQNPEIIAPLICCDGEGYKDDALGTYTGSANALIQNPSDVRRHLLVAVLGRTMAEIGDSFGTMRTTYAGRIAGGYKWAFILSRIGTKPSAIIKSLDEQTRSQMREDGGKFELTFNSTSDPTSVITIGEKDFEGEPVFDFTAAQNIKNKIRAVYDLDWSGLSDQRKYGNYKKQTERSNAGSITKYGELAEDWELPAVQVQAMAEDVTDWILLQKKDVISKVNLPIKAVAVQLERGDHFTLNDVFTTWSGLKWRILDIRPSPDQQKYQILAIKFISS